MNAELTTTRREWVTAAGAVFLVALATGLPSLRGGFLAGDDYHLVLNHVLVNHPSVPHAIELFTIVHRDLYQPIPLLSLSLNFAMIDALGLTPSTEGPSAGAWVFHLTNAAIHASVAVLVLFVMRRLGAVFSVAFVAAILFAVHPLAAECIAWLNGRMMMLSTVFTLAALIAFDRWDERPTTGRGAAVLLLTLAAHMSKVSVALPALVAVFPLVRGRMPSRRWWAMWAVVAAISGFFTVFNIESSSDMFDIARSEMRGSPLVYCILALDQYFRQFVVPVGLSVWYPPPPNPSWGEPAVQIAVVTVALVFAIGLWSAKRTRVGILGLFWFVAAVFPTLPIVPARRGIGADRYVYLPMIGLAWIAAVLLVKLYQRVCGSAGTPTTKWTLRVAGFGIACVLAAVSATTQGYHRDDISAGERNIQTNPDFPGVYEQAAWAYYRHGYYQEAIDVAMEDLNRNPEEMGCAVHQVIGMSLFRMGRFDEAVASLNKAIEIDPKYGKCYSRLAQIQAELGRNEEAIANYAKAIEIMPFYNPAVVPLGSLFRKVGKIDEAIETYHQALRNNPYEVPAHLALAEIDISKERFAEAIERLDQLLAWMPENAVARTNIGVAFEAIGMIDDAAAAYRQALVDEPSNVTAAVNLAAVYARSNHVEDALRIYAEKMPLHATNLAFLVPFHDLALSIDRADLAAAAMIAAYNASPPNTALRAWLGYTLAQVGDVDRAAALLGQHPLASAGAAEANADEATWLMGRIIVALHQRRIEDATAAIGRLVALSSPVPPDAVGRLLADLQRFSTNQPDNPWPFLLTARVLAAQSKDELSRLAMEEFRRRCHDDDCRAAGGMANLE